MTTWTKEQVTELFELPFIELVYRAQTVHRENFNPNEIQLASLLSIKTGTCPEDCGYCGQSGHHETDIEPERVLCLDEVIERATLAKQNGATRFCMGAAWRNPPKKDFPKVIEMIKAVKELGMEACVTLGMLDDEQAQALHAAGLDFYNHNLDTSPEYYEKVTSTRTYQDRLNTLERVRNVGINTCCGGIIGMGETREDRVGLLVQLANLPTPPKSVPINRLMPVTGTPLANSQPLENFELVRTIAVARILMPNSYVRLSAGRVFLSEEVQTLCFMAGANSMWIGDMLLVTPNPESTRDFKMLKNLGMTPQPLASTAC